MNLSFTQTGSVPLIKYREGISSSYELANFKSYATASTLPSI